MNLIMVVSKQNVHFKSGQHFGCIVMTIYLSRAEKDSFPSPVKFVQSGSWDGNPRIYFLRHSYSFYTDGGILSCWAWSIIMVLLTTCITARSWQLSNSPYKGYHLKWPSFLKNSNYNNVYSIQIKTVEDGFVKSLTFH